MPRWGTKKKHKRVVYCPDCGWRGCRYNLNSSFTRTWSRGKIDKPKPCPKCGHPHPKRKLSARELAWRSKGGKNGLKSNRPFFKNRDTAAAAGRKGGKHNSPRTFSNPEVARRTAKMKVTIDAARKGQFPPKPTFTWKW